ncbi:ABC transporter permease [Paraburkholderia sediminicola]|uniref:ABC transporter permease n=1 Tax=Paraburkholderia rhynchosiae TaxID=487049 RepID=A0ACC7NAG1_9BURK
MNDMLNSRRTLLLVLVVVVMVGGQWAVPGFTNADQLANQLKIATFLGLFGISQTLVMIAGGQGLDLSVGAAATLGGIVGAAVIGAGPAWLPLALVAAALCGAVVGLINGLGITVFRVPPLVMTLAMASLVDGGLIVWSSLLHVNTAASPTLVALAGRSVAGVPTVAVLWLVAGTLVWWFLDRSAWGRRLMATGANPTAALLTGARVRVVRIAAYTASAIIAALTGVLLVGYVGQAFLGLGSGYVLTSVVVAVIGGVSLSGGRGDYVAVAMAAVFITVLTSLLTALQIGEAGRQCIFGATLLVFLAVNGWSMGRRAVAA